MNNCSTVIWIEATNNATLQFLSSPDDVSALGRRQDTENRIDRGEMEEEKITRFGDKGIIAAIAGKFKAKRKTTVLGIGDDAAVMENDAAYTLVSTDLLLEGIHFNLMYFPLKHLGYKSVVRAISDIYAMGGTPARLLVGLGISGRFTAAMIEELYEGIGLACREYDIDLAGGDTTGSLTGLTISVTATGSVDKEDIVRRSGAKPNDLICVTGDLGAAYIGLQILERERKLFEKMPDIQPDLSGADYVIGRQLKPELPVKVLKDLKDEKVTVTSMIDVTNGLAGDMLQICRASNMGCMIYHDKVPIDYETSKFADEFNLEPLIPALNGGDDFEFLFTVPLEQYDKVKTIGNVKVIGHITEPGLGTCLVGDNGSSVDLKAPGW